MTNFKDLPWEEGLAKAGEAVAQGATLYQKFTCAQCGTRQTMDVPNTFYKEGECEECRHVTNIMQHGFGYMAHFNLGKDPA